LDNDCSREIKRRIAKATGAMSASTQSGAAKSSEERQIGSFTDVCIQRAAICIRKVDHEKKSTKGDF